MSEIDRDLQSRLKQLADEVEPDARRERVAMDLARTKRRLVAVGSGLMCLLLVGGIAGASIWSRGSNGIEPAPGPERVTEAELASMDAEELAAALFLDAELRDAVPSEAGFSADQIVRNGPYETNHDYATVGVRMTGPVDYARVIFFVHPDDAAAKGMYEKELYNARSSFRAARRSEDFRGWRPYAVANAAPGTKCSAGVDSLFTCMALRGRVVMLTQSSAGAPELGPKVSEVQLETAETLARSFSSYLNRIYPSQKAQPESLREGFATGGCQGPRQLTPDPTGTKRGCGRSPSSKRRPPVSSRSVTRSPG